MDVRELRSFLHVVESGSLSAAARRLNLSQPALSRQIKLLEGEAGVPLLRRTGRGVVPTRAGETMAERARSILAEIERLGAEFAGMRGAVRGTVRIAFTPSAGMRIAGTVARKFLSQHEEADLKISQFLSGAVRERLLEGRLDLGVLFDRTVTEHMRAERLWTERHSLIGLPEDMAGLGDEVPFPRLAELPLVLPGTQHALRMRLEQEALKQDLKLNVAVEVDSLAVQLELVRQGLGYTVLSRDAHLFHNSGKALWSKPIVDPVVSWDVMMAWSRDYPLTPAARAMADVIRDHVKELDHTND